MKKILIPLLMGMLCAPVAAEDVRHMMESMGYTEQSLYKHVPAKKFVPPPPARFEEKVVDIDQPSLTPVLAPKDFLLPRVYARSESVQMIPYLLKLQKQNPTSAQLTRKLAVTCLKNGQPREALHWYIQTYQRDRSDLESLWNMAALAYQLGDEDQTRKYLHEYADADPNSAWGRMAGQFLDGRFSGASMEGGFKSEFSRFGASDGASTGNKSGVVSSKPSSEPGNGILIIEGNRTTVERFVESFQESEPEQPVALKDTLKGKSGKSSVKAVKKEQKQKAAAVLPAENTKIDLNAVTTVAEPLSKSP